MGLESTYICIDSSEFQRNGDLSPSRLQAEIDAANLVSQCKLRSNAENNVGLIAMTDGVEVLATLTQDQSKLFMKLHSLKPQGYPRILTAVRIANLALKHRPSKNHKPRIVLFVGSPILDTITELKQVGKKLRKEKVAVDAIAYGETGVGEEDGNEAKLKALIDTLNGPDGTNNHLVVVSSGTSLTEALSSSAVCRGEDGSGPPVGLGGMGGDFDPIDDPELAMALRVSLEEQRARQEGTGGAEAGGGGPVETAPAPPQDIPFEAMTEEEQLAFALRMSMQEAGGEAAGGSGEAMETEDTPSEEKPSQDDELAALITDPNALQALVSGLPGVNPDSEVIKEAVGSAKKAAEDKKKDESKK